MTKKQLSVADINALRLFIKKATKPAPMTQQEREAKRRAQREAFKAEVLAFAQQHWDERYAALKEMHPACYPETALGERPRAYAPSLRRHLYERRATRF
jgi:hypothetical protein